MLLQCACAVTACEPFACVKGITRYHTAKLHSQPLGPFPTGVCPKAIRPPTRFAYQVSRSRGMCIPSVLAQHWGLTRRTHTICAELDGSVIHTWMTVLYPNTGRERHDRQLPNGPVRARSLTVAPTQPLNLNPGTGTLPYASLTTDQTFQVILFEN